MATGTLRIAAGMAETTADLRDLAANPRFEIGFGLAEVVRLMRQAFDQRMRTLGLTGSSWRILAYLSREDGQTQAALADRLEISRVALGEAVDRLEKTGHVERRADLMDRRKWRVHLTLRSQELLPLMFETSDELSAECFQDLREEDIEQLRSILERLRRRLHDMRIDTSEQEART